jgi:site-specific DNA-methyltransferase (adenine-specific)
MPRKEVIGNAELWLADCREVLPTLGRVDHVISDPPYEQISQDRIGGIKRNDGGKITQKLSFDGIDNMRQAICHAIAAQCRGWAVLFCTAEGVALWRDAIEEAGLKYKTPMIWVKPDSMPKFNGQGPALGYENIVTAWCDSSHSSWNGGGKRGVFSYLTNDPGREGTHPTEKPVPLMRELVALFSHAGQTILDPFMGSGTTGVACAKMGRNFIGIEREQQYFDIAVRRIEEAYRQPDMLISPPVKAVQEAMVL